jgi:hypothetical protein
VLRTREEILAARGESVDAVIEEHWRLVGPEATGTERSNVIAGEASLDFAAGRYQEAASKWRQSASDNASNLATDLPRAGRALLWAGDADGLRGAVTLIETSGVHGRVVDVHLRALKAAVAALEGRTDEAASEYAAALADMAELGLVFDQALSALDMGRVLGIDGSAVRTALADARSILERLGARPYLERLDGLVAGAPLPEPTTTGPRVAAG